MAEYIERNSLVDEMSKHTYTNTECQSAWLRATAIIQERPAADVVEVRHGEWMSADGCVFPVFRCSLCGSSVVTGKTHYCPNCGAKMDGKGEGE